MGKIYFTYPKNLYIFATIFSMECPNCQLACIPEKNALPSVPSGANGTALTFNQYFCESFVFLLSECDNTKVYSIMKMNFVMFEGLYVLTFM